MHICWYSYKVQTHSCAWLVTVKLCGTINCGQLRIRLAVIYIYIIAGYAWQNPYCCDQQVIVGNHRIISSEIDLPQVRLQDSHVGKTTNIVIPLHHSLAMAAMDVDGRVVKRNFRPPKELILISMNIILLSK